MKLKSDSRIYIATVIFEDYKKKIREMFIFRNNIDQLNEDLVYLKRKLKNTQCVFVASIVETLEENFSKDNLMYQEDVTFH